MLSETPSNISNCDAYRRPATPPSTPARTSPDLRGLNPFFGSRTLTLIDGQRAVSTNTLDSFDLNFIPQVLVQRIDTVTGGGSAVYGSGAVGGVVNIILDHQLEGGKFNADTYDTHYNDAKTNHVSAAYGHGLFDNRIHFVIGAEYQKQDPASCQFSGRSWCNSDTGPYNTGFHAWFRLLLTAVGSGLTTNISPNGVLSPAGFNGFGVMVSTLQPLTRRLRMAWGCFPSQATPDLSGGRGRAAPANRSNMYTNLVTAVQRAVISGMVTAKITDSINMHVDLNWGKVKPSIPVTTSAPKAATLGTDNPYLHSRRVEPRGGPAGQPMRGLSVPSPRRTFRRTSAPRSILP